MRAADLARRARALPVTRPWLVVVAVLLATLPAIRATVRLPVRTGLTELLPESRPSVVEFRRVRPRLSGVSTLIVVAEGADTAALRRFVDVMAPRIRALGPRYVAGVDEGNRAIPHFMESHKYLYADLEELRTLRNDVVARYDEEIGRRAGFDLGLSDEPAAPLELTTLVDRFTEKWRRAASNFGDGYYLAESGRLASIVVRTPFESGDPRAFELEERIRSLAADQSGPDLRILFTGDLVTSAEEHRAVTRDLAQVGTAGVSTILVIVFLFFLRLRVLVALCSTVAVACFWAFGLAFAAIGHLNSATGFLVSIIAGNGINSGIVLSARYLEARLRDHLPANDAVRTAMSASAPGTLVAALCASAAYGSLALTDFRGFRHFGVIGGAGMLFSWLASYTLLPAVLTICERIAPIRDEPLGNSRIRPLFAAPFLYLARRFRRPLVVTAAALGAASLAVCIRYVSNDPLEYDLSRLRSEATDPSSARVLAHRIEASIGRFSRNSRAILTDRFDQVAPLVTELTRRRDAAPPGRKPFERVVSVLDLLPADQSERVSLVRDIVDRARRARSRHLITEADWAKLEPELPKDVGMLGVADLPRDVAWPFEEADGTRGRIVYLVPLASRSSNDAHYLMQWANAFRELRLPDGAVLRGSGDAVLLADMIDNVRIDAPRAMRYSLLATLLIVVLAFRARQAAWLALVTILLGFVWLVACLSLRKVHVNFLNFVALPVSIGVGADYSVNVLARYELDRRRSVERGISETGAAIVLCSLTTLLGYAALTLSVNGAVRSFGMAGALGELTMLLSAMLVLPAVLLGRRATDAPPARSLTRSPSGK